MSSYKRPGVYIQEFSNLPPSVVEVTTAIPAFIGFTAKGRQGAVESARVSTLLEYEERFGRAGSTEFTANADGSIQPLASPIPKYMLWYALSLYFKNGGGCCWVISVDNESTVLNESSENRFDAGLKALEAIDEPTLVVMPELVSLGTINHCTLSQASLSLCRKLGDRFAILDAPEDIAAFRKGVEKDLAYGAAYYPYLDTALTHIYDEKHVKIVSHTTTEAAAVKIAQEALAKAQEDAKSKNAKAAETWAASVAKAADSTASQQDKQAADTTASDAKTASEAATQAVKTAEQALAKANETATNTTTLDALATTQTALYNLIKKNLAEQRVRLPPSAAVAGVYCRVDRERGVWKAPANVGFEAVVGPAVQITEEQQDRLNVDDDTGKSINAIRSFAGLGTLIWGARTLAGSDNEWRYVPVRRLFITVEESAKKATRFAVFEPNDATTWLKVKGMLESYLYGLWEQGALQGAEPKDAYYVHVGLNSTMTAQNILDGLMFVEIGIAAVRPAEFIVLRFSHRLAAS